LCVQAPATPKKQAPAAGGTEEPADSHVIVLDDASFKLHVDAHPVTMVEFYAPWYVPLEGAHSQLLCVPRLVWGVRIRSSTTRYADCHVCRARNA
jgi:hypothetical protein